MPPSFSRRPICFTSRRTNFNRTPAPMQSISAMNITPRRRSLFCYGETSVHRRIRQKDKALAAHIDICLYTASARSPWKHSYCIEQAMKVVCLTHQLVDMNCLDIKRQKCPSVTQSVAEARRNLSALPLYDAATEGSEQAAVRTLPLRALRVKCRQKDVAMSNIERSHPEQRPPIVLTAMDRETLSALLGDPLKSMDTEAARFLREEIERADIVPDDVAPNSLVSLGCDVKFVDHADARIRRAQLVFPEEAQCNHCISVLSPVGSALIGLGPGQSICWTEQGRERSLAVLEVRASGCGSNVRRDTRARAAARGSCEGAP